MRFLGKLGLYKYCHCHGKFEYFPHLTLFDPQAKNTVYENEMLIYINHAMNLEVDLKSRFCDLQGMVVPDHVISPFE